MTRAKSLMALILAVLWLPVTMHCALETLPGFQFLVCCAHEDATPHEDNDCAADACAVVESGFYKIQDHEELVAASGELVVFDIFAGQVKTADFLVPASRPPPDLIVGWQFSSRAAAPIRAPSFLL